MNDKSKTAFYGAGLSLVIGYLLSFTSRAIIEAMLYFIALKTSMTPGQYSDLYYFAPMSIRVAALLCTCIFLAIGFFQMSKTIPFIFALTSITLLIGIIVPDILFNGDFVPIAYPYTKDPTYLSITIFNCLFWFSFLVLLFLSAIFLKNDTESNNVRRLRMAFFILLGLSIFSYFMDYLDYFISFSTETLTVYLVIYNVFYVLEIAFAVAAGILFIIYARQK